MKFISYNINGIKAFQNWKFINKTDYDFVGLQEIRNNDLTLLKSYEPKQFPYIYWSVDTKIKGHAGVAIFTKHKPINVSIDNINGRYIILEYKKIYVVSCYLPHAGFKLEKLDDKLYFLDMFTSLLNKLSYKPIIVFGDFNVAPNFIDVANPNPHAPDFTQQERDAFLKLCKYNLLVDAYRYIHPTLVKYSYFSKRSNSYKTNNGWRIDHFLVSQSILKFVKNATIHDDIYISSDHVPVTLELN